MPDLEFYSADDAETMMAGYEAAGLVPVTFGGETKSQSMTWRQGSLEEMFGGGASSTSSGVSVSLRTSMSVGAFFAGARVIAEDVAKLPLALREYTTKADGGTTTRWLDDHHLVRLLREPNEYMTSQEFIEIMIACAVMTGEAYALKTEVGGHIEELWPLLPGQCIFRESDWDTNREANYDIYHDQGYIETVPAAKLVRLRGFGIDQFAGSNIVRQAREAIATNTAIMRSQGKLFGANQRPSGVLTTEEPLDKRPLAQAPPRAQAVNPHGANQNAVTMQAPSEAVSAHDRLRRQWNSQFGSGGEGGVAVLDRGFRYQAIDVTNADADTLKVWEAMVAEVCRVLRVSPVKVMQAAGSVSYNSLEQTNYSHLTDTLEPWLIRVEQSFARDLLTYEERHGVPRLRDGRRQSASLKRLAWFFDREEYLRPLPTQMMEIDVKAIQTGIMTRNEVRERRDLPRFEDPEGRADNLFAPLPTNPGGNPATSKTPPSAPKPEPSADAQP